MSRRQLKSALSGTNMQLPDEDGGEKRDSKRKRSDRDDAPKDSPGSQDGNILSRLGGGKDTSPGESRDDGRRRRGNSRDRDGRGDRRRSISPSESRDRGGRDRRGSPPRDDRRRDRDRDRSRDRGDRRGSPPRDVRRRGDRDRDRDRDRGDRDRRGSPPRDDRRRGDRGGDRRKRGRSVSPSEENRREKERGDRDRRAPEGRDSRAKAPTASAKPTSGGKKIREDIRKSIAKITAKAFVPALSNPLVLLSKSLCGEDLFEEIAPIRYPLQEVASTKERRASTSGNRRASRRSSAGQGLTDGSGEGTKDAAKSEEKESGISGGENNQGDELNTAGPDDSVDLYGDVGDMDMYGDLDTSFAGGDVSTDQIDTTGVNDTVDAKEEEVVNSTVHTGAIAKSYPMEAIPQSSYMVSTKRMKLISDALQGAGFSSSFQRSFDDAKALLSK